MKEPNNEEAKESFKAHIDKALGSRQIYWDSRAKAVRNPHKGYFSIIVDAGGGSGCTHLPRFRSTEKGISIDCIVLHVCSLLILLKLWFRGACKARDDENEKYLYKNAWTWEFAYFNSS